MKLFKNIIVLILSLFCLFPLNVHAQENFDISNYDVKMIVHEDGSIDIQEKIDLVYTTYVHGFYRNIPSKYEMDFGNGRQTYYFPVSDIYVSGDPFEIESSLEGVQIRIGDPDEYVNGFKSYDISYKVQTRDLGLDFDLFYWNIIGSFDCKIDNISFEIKLPKNFDAASLEFYGAQVNYDIENNVIKGKTLNSLNNYEQLTIYLELNDHYFAFKEIPDYTNIGIILCSVLLAIFIFLYARFGKQDKVIPIVSFEAPKGLGSVGVGYVIDGEVNNKDVLSMIIDFANRGYLMIHDTEDDTILTKIKDLDNTDPGYEYIFFDALFKNRDEVSCKQLEKEYFGDRILGVKELVSNYFHLKDNKVFAGSSLAIQILLCIFAGLAGGCLSMLASYAASGYWGITIFPLILIWILISFGMIFWIIISRQKYAYKKSTLITMIIIACIFNIIGIGISYIYLRNHLFAFGFVIIYTILIIYMIATSGKRTKQGNKWLNEILGLKDFIEKAEHERLEMLVHDNPSYFYHVLPYAYVLGISDTWSKKFEKINISSPIWYSSYDNRSFNTVYWTNRFYHSMNHLNSAASSIKPVESGSGGFSSSGGGFSGGGFGGGSGGSW